MAAVRDCLGLSGYTKVQLFSLSLSLFTLEQRSLGLMRLFSSTYSLFRTAALKTRRACCDEERPDAINAQIQR